jgi:hypothetical protein
MRRARIAAHPAPAIIGLIPRPLIPKHLIPSNCPGGTAPSRSALPSRETARGGRARQRLPVVMIPDSAEHYRRAIDVSAKHRRKYIS